ncbi:MAG: tail fiber domain-containing protein, partial [Flavobacteriales bacterium]|nr:tail fiber domain-containing protein [Flavobacteriales bacterium]
GIELLNSGGATAAEWDLYIPSSSTDFRVSNGTTDHVTIQNDGDVGIGTTSPSSLLQVGETDNASNSAITVAGNGTGSQEGGELRLATAADYDGTYDNYRLDVYEDYFRIGRQSKSDFLIKSNGYCGIGSDNTIGTNMSPATPLEVSNYNATTNSVVDIFTLSQVTSGTPAAGIGAGLIFEIQDGGNIEEQGRINVELDDVTNGSEDATMTFDINKNGTITEVMRIDGTQGYVGIGTSSPSTLLQVGETDNGGNATITIAGNTTGSGEGGELRLATAADFDGTYENYVIDVINDDLRIRRAGITDLILTNDGYFGIGRTPTTNILEINGDASKTSAGDWSANSDARLKKDIQEMDSQEILNKMLRLKGITYLWNDTVTGNNRPTELQYGFTAQNIQEVFPLLVEEDNLGYLQTAYGTYDAMYVESMRALQQQIDEQQAIIQAQKKENESQKAEIESLKAEASNSSAETNQKLDANTAEIEKLKAQLNALLQAQTATVSVQK